MNLRICAHTFILIRSKVWLNDAGIVAHSKTERWLTSIGQVAQNHPDYLVEPLGGTHHVSVHEHRRASGWAEEIKYLADAMCPDAEKIILVMDNLNTHKAVFLYKRYPPEEARRIIKKPEIHYTSKHSSWLDIAEIELNVKTKQCLSRRIAEIELL